MGSAAMLATRSRRSPLLLIYTVTLLAAGCLVVAAMSALHVTRPPLPVLAAVLALLTAGHWLFLSVRLGAQHLEIGWGEAGFLLASALIAPPWIVLLTPLAVLLCYAGRRPAIKTIYNMANHTLASSAGSVVLIAGNVSHPFFGMGFLILAGAGFVLGATTHFGVAGVVAVVEQIPFRETWRAGAGLQIIMLVGNLTIAIGALSLAHYGPWAVAVLPIAVVALHQAYEGRARSHQEREAGHRHAAAIGRITNDLDELGILRRAAEDACVLGDVDIVDIDLPADGRTPAVLYRHVRRGEAWTGEPSEAPTTSGRVIADLPVPTEDDKTQGRLRAWIVGGGENLRLGRVQEQALQSLAKHTGVAMRNARIHAEQTFYATHDRLTCLPSRQLLIEQIEAGLPAGARAEPVALLVIDVTGYREIARTLGFDVAEALLVRTARQLEQTAEGDEYVSHVATDQFGVYLPSTSGPAAAHDRAIAFLAAVSQPIELAADDPEAEQVSLCATVGAAYSPTLVGSGAELLRQACVALTQARSDNITIAFYDPARDQVNSPAAIVLASELRAALHGNQLDLHYQPIIDLPSGAPLAMEALLRWQHPTKGMLYGGEFAPVLERSPEHRRVVAWQLDRALRTRKTWGDRNLPVSVNLAARCLLDRRFPDQVFAILERIGVSAGQLMLEIAETAMLSQLSPVGEVLADLRTQGVQIAIDGLGAGTSSLFGLLRVPATHVKVDGHFVRQMLIDPDAMAVVCLGLDLGRRADLHFVATGVDNAELITALRRYGCDTAQGPHLMRPLLADEVPRYLASAPEMPEIPAASVVALDAWRHTPVP
jgi:diguanylate cyclase (GGDEF)-like protein